MATLVSRHAAWLAACGILITATAAAYVPQKSQSAATPRVDSGEKDFEHLLKTLNAREAALQKELDEAGPKMTMVRKRTIARGRAYYRLLRAGLLPIGGGFDALVDHAATVERLRAALSRDAELQRELKRRHRDVTAELQKVRAERAPLMIQQEAMNRAKNVMRQADERRVAFMRAFGNESVAPHVTVYGPDKSSAALASRFSQMRGHLALPLTGRSEVVTPRDPGEHNTLRIIAMRDTAVRAIYPGKVVFVGKTHHGNTVVLDHGENYYTVYGNLNHIEVKTNEVVTERARLAWVLRMGSRKPTLLFEIRKGKKLLDASKWLGL